MCMCLGVEVCSFLFASTPQNAVAVDTSIGACQGRGLGTTRDLCLVPEGGRGAVQNFDKRTIEIADQIS